MTNDQNKHIILDQKTGQLTVKGTSITVSMIIDGLSEGAEIGELCKRFDLTRQQIRAALDYIITVREKAPVYLVSQSYENNSDRRNYD